MNSVVRLPLRVGLTLEELGERQVSRVRDIGGDPARTLVGVSLCDDDLNAPWHQLAESFLGPFTLGSLAGWPIAGLTGMTAFAQHVPDGGVALVVYGPHIGRGRAGHGWVHRPGQHTESTCCGALCKLLADPHPPDPDLDTAQWALARLLRDDIGPARQADDPLQFLTEALYEKIHRRVQKLIHETRQAFRAPVLTVGGILINTGPHEDDRFEVMDQGIFTD